MVPDQVISLMDFGGPSFAMGDHDDHVHVGYAPGLGRRLRRRTSSSSSSSSPTSGSA